MEIKSDLEISLSDFLWLNEPKTWQIDDNALHVATDSKTDFWQGTWYNFHFNTGHMYQTPLIQGDFTITARVQGDFTTLYDQAGLMVYVDERHWLKAGIEYNEGQPMIGTVLTNGVSDWATGFYPGNPRDFRLRLTRSRGVVCVKFSLDNTTWTLLRLCPFPEEPCYAGPMCCSPQREGLQVIFSEIKLSKPGADILHSN